LTFVAKCSAGVCSRTQPTFTVLQHSCNISAIASMQFNSRKSSPAGARSACLCRPVTRDHNKQDKHKRQKHKRLYSLLQHELAHLFGLKSPCFQLQSGEKLGSGNFLILKCFCDDISCTMTQLFIYRVVQKNGATLHFPKYLENY